MTMPFWSSVVAMQTKKGMAGTVYHVSDINVRILSIGNHSSRELGRGGGEKHAQNL